MSKTINESDMSFGPYEDDDCFEIESSALYRRIKDGVKMVEFALVRRPVGKPVSVWLVEAKKSSPRPETQPDFDHFVDEIRQKLSNGLQTVLAACLERHPEASTELPAGFLALSLKEKMCLVLVINGHQEAWLVPIQDALRLALQTVIKTFGLEPMSVAVLNDEMARSRGLIS
jgi:hypothetical protein